MPRPAEAVRGGGGADRLGRRLIGEERRAFGGTGLSVTVLGLGAGAVGDPALSEEDAGRLLGGALDLGIALIDTARSYGASEERIGRLLASRRSEFVLSTKVGYGVPGVPDWTAECVEKGIDLALANLRTDRIDIVHLHSCPLEVLRRSEITDALLRARDAGKIRAAAYSGDNEPLEWAVSSGLFDAVQASVNVCDQRAIERSLPAASRRGFGVIAKRPLANAPWKPEPGAGEDAARDAYRERWRRMKVDVAGMDPSEFFLRFALSAPGVHAAIVGSRRLDHLEENVRAAERGPLPAEIFERARWAFAEHGSGWEGMV